MEEFRAVPLVTINSGKGFSNDTLITYIDRHKISNASLIGDFEYLLQDGFHVRACGRSTLLAISYIEHALSNPQLEVKIKDHHNLNRSHEHLLNKIHHIVHVHPDYKDRSFTFSKSRCSIIYDRDQV